MLQTIASTLWVGLSYRKRKITYSKRTVRIVRQLIPHRYVVADYERRSFSISQCDWSPNQGQNIVAIAPLSQTVTPAVHSHHISAGAIAGIVIGGSVALIFLLLAIYLLARKGLATLATKDGQGRTELDADTIPRSEMGGTLFKYELDGTQHLGAELDGRKHIGYEIEGSRDWVPELPAQVNIMNELPA